MAFVKRVADYIRRNGWGYTARRALEMADERLLHRYDRAFRRETPDEAELARQRANQPGGGLISVAVPLYNTKPAFLRALAESLLAQTYRNWQAVLYDGGSTDEASLAAMAALPEDPRLLLVHAGENAGISGNTNAAVAHCTGGYVALCDHDDVLAPDALWRVADAIARCQPDMIYTDEDKLTEDGRLHTDPHRKPDFSPDNLRSGNYICHLTVVRRDVLDAAGGLRPAFDGSQDHDLVLRVSERTQRICHIPRILYHWRTVGSSVSHRHLEKCQNAAARAVAEHMARIGYPGSCTVEDGALRLRYDTADLSVRTVRVPAENRCAFMNRAAAQARENVLLFADEALADFSDGFERELLMYAQRDDVGAVIPQIVDRRQRVFHAGYDLRDGRLVPRNKGLPASAGGWHGMNRTSHNVDAVGPWCFMVCRDHFRPFAESGTDEKVMADWCAALTGAGLRHVYTPHARVVWRKSGRSGKNGK